MALGAVGCLGLLTVSLLGAGSSQAADADFSALRTRGGWATAVAMQRDSDGDGWSDWAERFEGTDPYNANSHPDSVVVDIVGSSGFLQTARVPDRLAMIDVAGLEGLVGKDGTAQLLDVVTILAGVSPTGRLHSQLDKGIADLTGSGALDTMLADANAARQTIGAPDPLGPRTSGINMSLLALDWSTVKQAMDAVEFLQTHSVEVGESGGTPWVTVRQGDESQIHMFTGSGVDSITSVVADQPDGSQVIYESTYHDGVKDGFSKKITRPDGSWEQWTYDANGNLLSHNKGQVGPVPSASGPGAGGGSGPTAGPTSGASPSAAPSATSAPSGQPGSSATSDPSPAPSASATLNDPDAAPFAPPTLGEIRERVRFLSGVLVYTAQNKPELPTSPLVPEPGVSDPAEPECDQPQCVVFVEIEQPDLHNVNGGDPLPPGFNPSPFGRP